MAIYVPNGRKSQFPHRSSLSLSPLKDSPTVLINAKRTDPLALDALDFAESALTQRTNRTGKLDFANVCVLLANPYFAFLSFRAI